MHPTRKPEQGALEISLRIGQRVRHQEDFKGKRVTGVVRGLSVDGNDVLHADIALDNAIVIPPIGESDHELRIYRQHVPAHELAPFDEREELIAGMLQLLQEVQNGSYDADPIQHNNWLGRVDTAIAKAAGSAA